MRKVLLQPRARLLSRPIPTKADSENSWSVSMSDVDQKTFDLSVKNPSKGGEVVLRAPKEIMKEMSKLDTEIKSSILGIQKLL